MDKKLLIESLAKKVKTFVRNSSLTEEMQRATYDAIMEYRVSTNNLSALPTVIDLERAEFTTHYRRWRESTMLLQSMKEILESPHYNAIIKMGERAVPFILEHIQYHPDMLVLSLEEILGFSVLPSDRKIIPIDEQCQIWIKYFNLDYV